MGRLTRLEKEQQARGLIGDVVATLSESARRIERITGLTNAQVFFLCELADAGPLTITDLSKRSVTRHNTASLLVRRLAEQGLVRRQRATGDERRVVVTLTAKGRRIAKRAPPTPMKRMIRALGEVGPSRLRDLERIGALLNAMGVPERVEVLFEPRQVVDVKSTPSARIGTAGWSIPGAWQDAFVDPTDRVGRVDRVDEGEPGVSSDTRAAASHLERYARRFSAVEINSSFYRHHRRATYERWAATVPSDFRFAVKLPRTITHDQSLVAFDAPLDVFLEETSGLGDRLGPLLVQLPPSLQFDGEIAEEFFAGVRAVHGGDVVCEPRHPTWFDDEAEALLSRHRVARVAADPARVTAAARPGGSPHLVYIRLHGSPDMYRSSYSSAHLEQTAQMLGAALAQANGAGDGRAAAPSAWCIFDNTTLGAATGNALELQRLMRERGRDGTAGS